VETNIELAQGQSFVIGGLIDDRVTENLAKIPALGDIPILGQIFRSPATSKSKTELIVLVSPEVVNPIKPGAPLPELPFPKPFLPAATSKGAAKGKSGKAMAAQPTWPDKDRLRINAKDSGLTAAVTSSGRP